MAQAQQTTMPPIPPYYYRQQRTRWWIPLLIIGIILFLIIALIAGFFISLGSAFEKEPYTLKPNSVLYLNMGLAVSEYTESNPLDFLVKTKKTSFNDIIQAIKRAKTDDNIEGIYYKASLAQMGFAKAMELQDVLRDFKSSGKFIYAFIETGRELDYFNALPADKIFMPEEGIIEMNGFGISTVFLKGLFDKVGIDFHIFQFEDFKSAGEGYNRNKFSDSARYEYQVILDQRLKIFVDAVAGWRSIDKNMIRTALSRGIYTSDSLQALGFVDSLIIESDFKNMLREISYKGSNISESKKKLRLVSISNYLSASSVEMEKIAPKDTKIAIIYGVGAIQTKLVDNPFESEKYISSEEMIKYLKKAREDKTVKAIILRIDSPGGSNIASDAIYKEIIKTSKVKPIYASLSDVAASGGYYIAIGCDTIVCHPATLTGSIGVIMAIPNISKLVNKVYLTADTISTGPAANDLNGLFPMTAREKEKFYSLSKGVYERFVRKVAQARNKTYEDTRALAKGRVWTGEDAFKRGLVDTLGGLETCISIAKRRIGIPESMKVYIRVFPEPEDEFAAFLKLFNFDNNDNDERAGIYAALATYLDIKPDKMQKVYNSLPKSITNSLNYMLELMAITKKEPAIMAMPHYIEIE